jgi:hypothetical protein
MFNMKIKRMIGLVVLLIVAGIALASIPAARANDDNQPPILPSPTCDNLQAPPGNKVAFIRTRWACRSTNGTASFGNFQSQRQRSTPTPTIAGKSALTTAAPLGRATMAATWWQTSDRLLPGFDRH